MSKSKSRKNSLLVGGLTSTAGLFITKAIGLLYVAPFRAMVGAENYVYYAAGYELYDLMLTISLAGLPFAIAALVSKYMEKEDYKSVMLVKKISQGLLGVFGFLSATVVLIFINQFIGTRADVSLAQASIYKNVYLIMTLSIFTVPILSSYRGFFQGIKDYSTYSLSQVVEQIARVAFLLGIGFLCVYILNTDRIYAVYAALLATFVSAFITIIYFAVIKKDKIDHIKDLSEYQLSEGKPSKELFIELFIFAIPYLISVILSSRYSFTNMWLLPSALQNYGYDPLMTQLYTSLITNETVKLIGIPTVLSTGFSVAVIPEMSQALVRNDYKTIQRNIRSAIESVMYIALPVLCAMFFLSDEIYYILFGGSLDYILIGGEVSKMAVLYSVVSILSPVIVSMLMTLNLQRMTMVLLAITFGLNFVLLPSFVSLFGYAGSYYINMLTSIIFIVVSLVIIKRNYKVKFTYTYRKLLLICLSLVPMYLVYFILKTLGLPVLTLSKLPAVITLGIYGLSMIIIYAVVTNYLYLPQTIINIDFKNLISKVVKK